MVGEAGLPGRHRLEDLRVSTLSLQVDERCVPRLEIQRRERLALQDKPEGDVLARVLAPADATPQTQIIDELEQFEVLRVAGDGAQDLLHEGLLDALATAVFAALLCLRAAAFGWVSSEADSEARKTHAELKNKLQEAPMLGAPARPFWL